MPKFPSELSSPWWPALLGAQPSVGMWMSTRQMPVAGLQPSVSPYNDFNLGDHVGDDLGRVQAHREAVQKHCQAQPVWLQQVHGNRVVRLSHGPDATVQVDGQPLQGQPQADGAFTTEPGLVCTVMVADCLPVLLAAPEGRGVAALHAGWRGLCGAGQTSGGVVDVGVAALCEATACDPADLMAWLGPCIGPQAFEVGADVLQGFGVAADQTHPAFKAMGLREGQARWLADLPALGRERLRQAGLLQVAGGQWCTVSDPSRFFSFRRDGVTGRLAACIWLRGR